MLQKSNNNKQSLKWKIKTIKKSNCKYKKEEKALSIRNKMVNFTDWNKKKCIFKEFTI